MGNAHGMAFAGDRGRFRVFNDNSMRAREMMMKQAPVRCLLAMIAILALGSASAYADTIGPGCSSCLGSMYTLENLGPGPLAANDWLIRLTVDTSQFNNTDPYNPVVLQATVALPLVRGWDEVRRINDEANAKSSHIDTRLAAVLDPGFGRPHHLHDNRRKG
jgi:hypothetical protein